MHDQKESGFSLAAVCPERSYTRKNIAYLEAIRNGAQTIVETDDDNHPLPAFWEERSENVSARQVHRAGWVNAYGYFTEKFIYPRGMPLNSARDLPPMPEPSLPISSPIHQGLADSDPDVDAVYRMLYPLPFHFEKDREAVLLKPGAWCPFNSQNTTFFKSVFPLLYLPANCSFRMTDIWRSFVAQCILHSRGFGVVFHRPTAWQDRNEHDLHRDFTEEIPGYSHNAAIREALESIRFEKNQSTARMLESCYEVMMQRSWIGREEEALLSAWLHDLKQMEIA